jgi:hypothetical protein
MYDDEKNDAVGLFTLAAIVIFIWIAIGCAENPFRSVPGENEFIHLLVGVWQSDHIVIEFRQDRTVEVDDGIAGKGSVGTWAEKVDNYLEVLITHDDGVELVHPEYYYGYFIVTHKSFLWGDRTYTEVPGTRPHAHGEGL